MRHRYILPLWGASSPAAGPPYFFVSPFMINGDLVLYLQRCRNQPPAQRPSMLKMMHQVAQGMAYLHDSHGACSVPECASSCLRSAAWRPEGNPMHALWVPSADAPQAANILVDEKLHCVVTDFGLSEFKDDVRRASGQPSCSLFEGAFARLIPVQTVPCDGWRQSSWMAAASFQKQQTSSRSRLLLQRSVECDIGSAFIRYRS